MEHPIHSIGLLKRHWFGLVGNLRIAFILGAMAFWLTVQCLFPNPVQATGIYDIPQLASGQSTWVLDQAEVLSRVSENQLTTSLNNLVNQTGQEVRFVTIRRLDYGETIQGITDKLFDKWFPTPESQANQTLVVLDNLTNNAAVHVGSEAARLVTESIAKSIVEETMMIPLQQGDKYNQAVLEAGDRLIAVLSGQPDPGPPVVNTIAAESTFTKAEDTDDANATLWVVGLVIAATVIPMATYFWYQQN
ncbi:MAG: TPM domain-containing protein [Synechococcales bacterium]|nr:TPM domain-containing protein [Synechococcales bacterium]